MSFGSDKNSNNPKARGFRTGTCNIKRVKQSHVTVNTKDTKIMSKCSMKDNVNAVLVKNRFQLAKRKKEQEHKLLYKLENLEHKLSADEYLQEYNTVKKEWEKVQSEKTEGIIFRAKLQWVEQGEKITKYFLNLEKQNYNLKYIKKLITNETTALIKPNEILEEERRFYRNLYSTRLPDNQELDQGSPNLLNGQNDNIPKLNDIEKQLCDASLKIEEIAKALKQLKNDKSPGSDGLTTNFYKFFWTDISLFLFDSFKYSFKHNLLSDDQRRGILNLIPKPNKDLRYLKNWRPVSILNTDYKILTKALSNRLQPLLSKLISSDQVGYIKDRQIADNIRIIDDIMSYTHLKHLPGYILLVDFEKAFDSVEWSFLYKTLKAFNFGTCFIQWIKILHTNIQSCVSNNG